MSHKKLRAVQEEARALIRDSIVEDAISRFIAQILEVAAQRNADRIDALEAENARAEAALAEARANGLREAEQECQRLAESYTRSLSHYDEDHPERAKIKWGAAAVTVAAENILARLTGDA